MNFFQRKSEYCFTFWIETDKDMDELSDLLYDIDCDDALVHVSKGRTYITFDREATDPTDAVAEAWDVLDAAGLGVKGVFGGDLQ